MTAAEQAEPGAVERTVPASCNACGGALKPRLDPVRDVWTRQAFSVLVCERCGLGHTSPVPADLGPYYGAVYYGQRHGVTAAYCAWRRVRLLQRVRAPSAPPALLDVGCGDGRFLLEAKKRGWRVAGVERYPDLSRAAGLEVRERVEDAEALGPFGCVTLWHTLEHLPDPHGTLARIRQLLAPGGMLLVAVPDWGGDQAGLFKRLWIHLDVPRHLYHFNAPSLSALMRRCGFSVVRTWHQELEYDLMGWSQSALNAISPSWSNAFFGVLTGKRVGAGAAITASSAVLGSLLLGLSVPAVTAGTLRGRGGTLIMAARRLDTPTAELG